MAGNDLGYGIDDQRETPEDENPSENDEEVFAAREKFRNYMRALSVIADDNEGSDSRENQGKDASENDGSDSSENQGSESSDSTNSSEGARSDYINSSDLGSYIEDSEEDEAMRDEALRRRS